MSYKGTSEFIAYVEALEAKVERLEKVVKEISESDSHVFDEDPCGQLDYIMDLAKKALEGE